MKTRDEMLAHVRRIRDNIAEDPSFDHLADVLGAGSVTFEVEKTNDRNEPFKVVGGCIYAPEMPRITDEFVLAHWGGEVLVAHFTDETRRDILDFFKTLYHC